MNIFKRFIIAYYAFVASCGVIFDTEDTYRRCNKKRGRSIYSITHGLICGPLIGISLGHLIPMVCISDSIKGLNDYYMDNKSLE